MSVSQDLLSTAESSLKFVGADFGSSGVTKHDEEGSDTVATL